MVPAALTDAESLRSARAAGSELGLWSEAVGQRRSSGSRGVDLPVAGRTGGLLREWYPGTQDAKGQCAGRTVRSQCVGGDAKEADSGRSGRRQWQTVGGS